MNADRPNSASEASQRFRVDDLIVDLGQQEVRRNSSRLDVPKLSFDLFLALIRAAPNLLSIDELMERVWPGLVVNPETVTRRVKMLRDALGDDPDQPRYIGGLRGRGYRLVAPVSPEFGSPTQSRAVSMPQTPAGPSDRASKSQRGLRGTTWFVAGMLGLLTLGSIVVMRREWATEHARAVPQQFLVTARPPRSVAVLPFENLGAQPSDEYLALGISETLLNRLGAVPELLVISGRSASAVASERLDVHEIGRKLHARYLVGGTVQHEGQRLRITVQLTDSEAGRQLKSLRFERAFTSLFAMQDQIADETAAALETSLGGPKAHPGTGRTRSTNLDAYLAYLKGKALLAHWRLSGLQEAAAEFTRAIQLDPDFAAPYAELAATKLESASLHWQHPASVSSEVKPLLEKALARDGTLGEAYVMRGVLESEVDPTHAEADFRQGLALNPGYGDGFSLFAQSLYGWHRASDALEALDRARLIDPLSARNLYLKGLYISKEYGSLLESEQLLLQALELDPDFIPALTTLARWRWGDGQSAEALKLVERAIRIDPQSADIQHQACAMFLDVGDITSAEQVIAQGDNTATPGRMLMALYKGDWRLAGAIAYALPPHLVLNENSYEVSDALYRYALHTGAFGRAEGYLRKIHDLNPGHEMERDSLPAIIMVADLTLEITLH